MGASEGWPRRIITNCGGAPALPLPLYPPARSEGEAQPGRWVVAGRARSRPAAAHSVGRAKRAARCGLGVRSHASNCSGDQALRMAVVGAQPRRAVSTP